VIFGIDAFRDFGEHSLSSYVTSCHTTASLTLTENIAPEYARSHGQSHTMARQGYQRDEWRILTLNDAVEDPLFKILRFFFFFFLIPLMLVGPLAYVERQILRFGVDVDYNTENPADADFINSQLITWAKYIATKIPGYSDWQGIRLHSRRAHLTRRGPWRRLYPPLELRLISSLS